MTGLIDDPALTLTLQAHKLHRLVALDDEAEIRDAYLTIVPQLSKVAGEYACSIRAMFALHLREREAVAVELPSGNARGERAAGRLTDPEHRGGGGCVRRHARTARDAARARCCRSRAGRSTPRRCRTRIEGPVTRLIGLLEASLGRVDAADARLGPRARSAVRTALRPWLARAIARTRTALAPRSDASAQGRALCAEAAALAAELGMRGLRSAAPAALWQPTGLARTLEADDRSRSTR